MCLLGDLCESFAPLREIRRLAGLESPTSSRPAPLENKRPTAFGQPNSSRRRAISRVGRFLRPRPWPPGLYATRCNAKSALANRQIAATHENYDSGSVCNWRAANRGRSRLFRRPEPAESRLRAELPSNLNYNTKPKNGGIKCAQIGVLMSE
jgi:hypothetical protein